MQREEGEVLARDFKLHIDMILKYLDEITPFEKHVLVP